jgi:hypothetical protein
MNSAARHALLTLERGVRHPVLLRVYCVRVARPWHIASR